MSKRKEQPQPQTTGPDPLLRGALDLARKNLSPAEMEEACAEALAVQRIAHVAPVPSAPSPLERRRYDFAHGRRCPGCRGLDTQAVSTQHGIQYRTCARVGCKFYRKNYPVVGKEI
jgi:Zn ribbon nucleic-acid-binding protein